MNEKIAKLKEIFESLDLPVEFRERRFAHKWAVVVYGEGASFGKEVTYLEPDKYDLEQLVAQATSAVFKTVYKRLRRRVKNKEDLTRYAYYYVVGYLGNFIRSDIPETARKMPKWLKKLGFPDWTHPKGFKIDHVFYSKEGEFVSEPYDMHMRDFENLIEFCREHALEFSVQGESTHFPGHTFRVTIKPKVKR